MTSREPPAVDTDAWWAANGQYVRPLLPSWEDQLALCESVERYQRRLAAGVAAGIEPEAFRRSSLGLTPVPDLDSPWNHTGKPPKGSGAHCGDCA